MGVSLEEPIQYNIFHKEIYNFKNLMYFFIIFIPSKCQFDSTTKEIFDHKYVPREMSVNEFALG